MNIRQLNENDRSQLLEFLERKYECNMFFLESASKYPIEYNGSEDSYNHGNYWAMFDENNDLQAVLYESSRGSVFADGINTKVVDDLFDHVKYKFQFDKYSVLGDYDLCINIAKAYNAEKSNIQSNHKDSGMKMDIKDIIIDKRMTDNYVLKPINELDLDEYIKWALAYEIECLGAKNNDETHKMIKNDCVRNQQKHNRRFCLFVDGNPVAMCSTNSEYKDIVQFGAVFVPEHLRSKGYARAIITKVLQAKQKQGFKRSVLFTESRAAYKAYKSVGYKDCSSYLLFMLHEKISKNSFKELVE